MSSKELKIVLNVKGIGGRKTLYKIDTSKSPKLTFCLSQSQTTQMSYNMKLFHSIENTVQKYQWTQNQSSSHASSSMNHNNPTTNH